MSEMPRHPRYRDRRRAAATLVRATLIVAMMFCGLSIWSPDAMAQSLDQARASGMVGERFDGFAMARESATPAARGLVESVNKRRAQIYAKRASEQKISRDQVGKVYAAEIFEKAPKGTWFLQESGRWVRK